MDGFVITAALLKLGYAAAAAVLVVVGLRYFDKSIGIAFGDTMARIRESPVGTAIYFGARIMAVCLLVGMVIGCAPREEAAAPPPATPAARLPAAKFPSKYDGDIREAVDAYWVDYPFWLAWKAVLYQESRLNPAAVSPAGARGLAQFLPGTFRDVQRALRLPPDASPHHDIAIAAGAYYMASLRRQWSAPRPVDDRFNLGLASYNAGLGNVLGAQRACGGAALYDDIMACLPQVTGAHARETLGYAPAIWKWRRIMEAGG